MIEQLGHLASTINGAHLVIVTIATLWICMRRA